MSEDRLRNAISDQANDLKRRAEWLQQLIDRQTQVILNCQATIEAARPTLQAVNLSLDGLRAEYRKLIEPTSKE